MSKNLVNKYVWLVDTIYRKQRVSFQELGRLWLDSDLSEGEPLSKRTFHKWRIAAEEMFGLIIENEKGGDYGYYIENPEELKNNSVRNWLLNTLSVSNLLGDSECLRDRILLEDVPSGREHLQVIINAMKEGLPLAISHQGYWSDFAKQAAVEPYCVKMFRRRWYMLARRQQDDRMRVYALDRILSVEPLRDAPRFDVPRDFSAEGYFRNYFGVIVDDGTPLESVRLQVSAEQANYLRSVPLHHSQRETSRREDYSVFTLRLHPTYDFQKEILSYASDIEVLSPAWLREEMAAQSARMSRIYRPDADAV